MSPQILFVNFGRNNLKRLLYGTFFIYYFVIVLIIFIANCFSGDSSGGRESEEQMRIRYEQKIQEIRRKTERLQKENERLRKIKL